MPKTTVIIPVFNHANLTARCLRTLLEQNIEDIVVVDDGSTDGTQETLRSFGNSITAIIHKENRGFAAACNTGARLASGDYLVFLNNDTVPAPGWLEALEQYANNHKKAAAVGSKLVYPDGRVQHAGVVICQDRYPRHLYSGFPGDHPAVSKARQFQIVTGACMLVPARVFERERGFDTAFQNGFEDVDFCLRLRAHGHEIHFCPESVVEHLESVSAGRFKHDSKNVALYRERWFGRVQPDDLGYYIEDGLLTLNYEGEYPINLVVSPLLATRVDASQGLEPLLRQARRQIAELSRENTRLSLELDRAPDESAEIRYRRLRTRIREVVEQRLPQGATVLVISKGDGALLELPGCVGWHFPRTEHGAYAGHHPHDSAEAVAHLEALRLKGAEYLLIPETSRWWLEHYLGLRRYLQTCCAPVEVPGGACAIYRLGDTRAPLAPSSGPSHALDRKHDGLVGLGDLNEIEPSTAL